MALEPEHQQAEETERIAARRQPSSRVVFELNKRQGAIKSSSLAERATRLLLYNQSNTSEYYYFELTDRIEGADYEYMKAINYPGAKQGNEYFLYELASQLPQPNVNISQLINKFKPEGWSKGAPIFIAFTGDISQLESVE